MPLKKISPLRKKNKPCLHREHNPPMHMYFEPEVYEWTCPGCGRSIMFSAGVFHWNYNEGEKFRCVV